jgi:hypothetical protein
VRVTDDTAIFDQNGDFGGSDLLDGQEGERVHVRGRLDKDARLQASVVVLGKVLMVKGSVDDAVDDLTNLFPLTPFPGEALVGQHDVEVADETLILSGCDDEVPIDAIRPGMIARVIGKLVRVDGADVLRSVVIFLRARAVSGQITSIVDEVGGKTVTVDQNRGGEIDVFVPEGTPIYIEGDGLVPMELFCVGRQVRIFIDPETLDPLTAKSVLVQSERRVGEVISVDDLNRTLTIDGESVFVQPGATILDTRGKVDTLVGFEAIEVNDHLQYFGLEACPGDMGFTAFVIVLLPEPDLFLPEVINDNNVSIFLFDGRYDQSLTVNGNNFTLTGKKGEDCSSPGGTTITGPVEVNGNGATFKNIRFRSTVDVNGNNADFINCCFLPGEPTFSGHIL